MRIQKYLCLIVDAVLNIFIIQIIGWIGCKLLQPRYAAQWDQIMIMKYVVFSFHSTVVSRDFL